MLIAFKMHTYLNNFLSIYSNKHSEHKKKYLFIKKLQDTHLVLKTVMVVLRRENELNSLQLRDSGVYEAKQI